MRICFIQDWLRNGGTERQTLLLVEYLQEQGHEVHLLLFRPGGRLWARAQASIRRVHVLQVFDTKLPLLAPGLTDSLLSIDPDVVVCMGRTANCYSGYLKWAFPGLSVVGSVRTGKRLFPLHRWSLRQVDHIWVNSYWWQDQLQAMGIPLTSITVTHNGSLFHYQKEKAAKQRQALRQELGIDESTRIFLNVAGFRKGKRHQELICLFAQLSELLESDTWRLWLVGDGPRLRRCRALARKMGLSDRVQFWGYQDNPETFYHAADVAVSVSQEDSLPNFLIEAQSLGKPVLAYDYRGVKECCDLGNTGFIIPSGDSDAFVAHARRFISDEASVRRMGEAGVHFALNRFGQANQSRELEQVLLQIKA